jgi:hypothetical protein
MPANTTFVSGAILTAAQMNALPWGIVDTTSGGTSGRGYIAKNSANFTMTTTVATVTDMNFTFNAVAGRLYKASFIARAANVATAQNIIVYITDGSNVVKQAQYAYMIGGGDAIVTISQIFTGLTGSQTLRIRAKCATASSAILVGDSESYQVFCIEDIGPA